MRRLVVLAWKEVVVTARRPVELLSILVFAAAAAVATGYGVGSSPAAYPALLFVTPTFMAMFAALAGFIREAEEGTLDGIRLAPVPVEEVYYAKLLATFLLVEAVTLVYWLLSVYLSGAPPQLLNPMLALALTIFSLYAAAVASLASALLVYSGARGVLVPVVVMVLLLPAAQVFIPLYREAIAGIPDYRAASVLVAASLGYSLVAAGLSRVAVS